MECCCVLTAPTTLVLAYYTNLVVDERPGAAKILHFVFIEFVTKAMVWLLPAAE